MSPPNSGIELFHASRDAVRTMLRLRTLHVPQRLTAAFVNEWIHKQLSHFQKWVYALPCRLDLDDRSSDGIDFFKREQAQAALITLVVKYREHTEVKTQSSMWVTVAIFWATIQDLMYASKTLLPEHRHIEQVLIRMLLRIQNGAPTNAFLDPHTSKHPLSAAATFNDLMTTLTSLAQDLFDAFLAADLKDLQQGTQHLTYPVHLHVEKTENAMTPRGVRCEMLWVLLHQAQQEALTAQLHETHHHDHSFPHLQQLVQLIARLPLNPSRAELLEAPHHPMWRETKDPIGSKLTLRFVSSRTASDPDTNAPGTTANAGADPKLRAAL